MINSELCWDAVIIGSGPAGSASAITLARTGLKVLLIEKQKLPRHKMCSGMISKGSTANILKDRFDLDFPAVLCRQPDMGNGAKVYYRLETEPEVLAFPYYNVLRRDFDFWLLLEASKAGVTIRQETLLVSMKETNDAIELEARTRNKVSASSALTTMKARYVIGADGIGSMVKRILFPDAKIHSGAFVQEYWEGTSDLDPHWLHAFMDKRLSSGYAWCNYKDDQLIIGVGSEKGSDAREYQSSFIEYLIETHGLRLRRRIRVEGCLRPTMFTSRSSKVQYLLGKGNCVLVGDAAELYDIMGEGIPSALVSGKKAADSILEHVQNPRCDLSEIYTKSMKEHTDRLRANWLTFLDKTARSRIV